MDLTQCHSNRKPNTRSFAQCHLGANATRRLSVLDGRRRTAPDYAMRTGQFFAGLKCYGSAGLSSPPRAGWLIGGVLLVEAGKQVDQLASDRLDARAFGRIRLGRSPLASRIKQRTVEIRHRECNWARK